MINIDLICVGALKLDIFKQAEKNILKKTDKNYNIKIIEIEDEKNQNINRSSEIEKIKEKEGSKILSKIKKGNYVITLEIDAKQSKNLSICNIINETGRENISIIIGGSVGLSKKVSDISNKKISISKMTFPHKLMRLVMLEQFIIC
ncbi:23S rRNA (pseudouridine(1915)-N(3))-methyltransferase RlmH [Peptoanaerobacter stomatis]